MACHKGEGLEPASILHNAGIKRHRQHDLRPPYCKHSSARCQARLTPRRLLQWCMSCWLPMAVRPSQSARRCSSLAPAAQHAACGEEVCVGQTGYMAGQLWKSPVAQWESPCAAAGKLLTVVAQMGLHRHLSPKQSCGRGNGAAPRAPAQGGASHNTSTLQYPASPPATAPSGT